MVGLSGVAILKKLLEGGNAALPAVLHSTYGFAAKYQLIIFELVGKKKRSECAGIELLSKVVAHFVETTVMK